MVDVSSTIIQIQQQIIEMQKINGSSWLKTISLLFGIISPLVSLIYPFIAFKLGFRSVSKLEKEKKKQSKRK